MLVLRSNFVNVVDSIRACSRMSLDTETTSLTPFQNGRMFSIIIGTGKENFYFNFNVYPGITEDQRLSCEHLNGIGSILQDPSILVYMHNAKFDLHILSKSNIEVQSKVHCTLAMGRLIDNNLMAYSLEAQGQKFLGEGKDDGVKKYLEENNHFAYKIKGAQKKKDLHYFKAPLDVIVPYGEKDTDLTFRLGEFQNDFIDKWDSKLKTKKCLRDVYNNELDLTKTLYAMESRGIMVDEKYCRKAMQSEKANCEHIAGAFKKLTGVDFIDNASAFVPAFEALGLSYAKTEKGNASFSKEALESIDNPVANIIKQYRASAKRYSSYYRNFLEMCDSKSIIHTNFKQGGAATGRMSATDPALQTLPKPKEDDTGETAKVRKAFIPRSEYYCFFVPDYDQMEYRFLLEYAKEKDVIAKVNAGMDVHEATADIMGSIDRDSAKTINFLLLYGGGIGVFAKALKMSKDKAKLLKSKYFRDLPMVQRFIKGVIGAADQRGYIINWMGRVSRFDWHYNPKIKKTDNGSFKAPNYLIQGGTADVCKLAMNRCHALLQGTKSYLILQVHDELVFEIHRDDIDICPKLVEIMETVYRHRDLQLTCSPEYSFISLADKKKGYPTHDEFKRAS